QRVNPVSHCLNSFRQFVPDVAFDLVNVTFSAFFIDPNGDRLYGGRVIGRRGQSHAYLFAASARLALRAWLANRALRDEVPSFGIKEPAFSKRLNFNNGLENDHEMDSRIGLRASYRFGVARGRERMHQGGHSGWRCRTYGGARQNRRSGRMRN